MRTRDDHGLHTIVMGLALLLLGIVLFFVGQRLFRRPPAGRGGPAHPPADSQKAVDSAPGMSRTIEPPVEIPALLIQKTGRPARHRKKTRVPTPK